MSVFEESGIEFDFTAAIHAHKHDAINQVFRGVDFIIEEPDLHIWLEVKNWEPSSLPARRRGGQRRAFLARMSSKSNFFTDVLRAKFVGTAAYLHLRKIPPTKNIHFVALLESPRMTSTLLGPKTTRLQGLVRRSFWKVGVEASVMNLAEWNARFPEYPANPF